MGDSKLFVSIWGVGIKWDNFRAEQTSIDVLSFPEIESCALWVEIHLLLFSNVYVPFCSLLVTLTNFSTTMFNISGQMGYFLSCFLLSWQPKLVICNSLCHVLRFVCVWHLFLCPGCAANGESALGRSRFSRVAENQQKSCRMNYLSVHCEFSLHLTLVSFHELKALLHLPNIHSET